MTKTTEVLVPGKVSQRTVTCFYQAIVVEGNQVDVDWDLRYTKFTGSPEPSSDYYIALVSAMFLVKKVNIFWKKSFSTKARFNEKKRHNEIVVDRLTGNSTND
ncbi:DUF868 family protein [Medicago truncatula]|uniref:DUF868 family protein n=1 Tax=Medicago truncatula TaxID=3880 RepID=G7KE33_MEDTR|nr:DUF868 family protein [Medicago truncatula]